MKLIEELLKKLTALFSETDSSSLSFEADADTEELPSETDWLQRQIKKYQPYEETAAKNIELLKDPNISSSEKKRIQSWFIETYGDLVDKKVERFMKLHTPEFVNQDRGEVDQDLEHYISLELIWKPFLLTAKGETGILKFDPTKGPKVPTPFLRSLISYMKKPLYTKDKEGKLQPSGSVVRAIKKAAVAQLGLGTKDDETGEELGGSCIAAPVSSDFSSEEKELACMLLNVLDGIISGKVPSETISAADAKAFKMFYALGSKRPKYIDMAKELNLASVHFASYASTKDSLKQAENDLINKGAEKQDLENYAMYNKSKRKDSKEAAQNLAKSFLEKGITQPELDYYEKSYTDYETAFGKINQAIRSRKNTLEKENVKDNLVKIVSQKYKLSTETVMDVIALLNKLEALADGEGELEFGPLLEHLIKLIKILSEWEAGGPGAMAAEPSDTDFVSTYDKPKYKKVEAEVDAMRDELRQTDSDTVKLISSLKTEPRVTLSLDKKEKDDILTKIYDKYSDYVKGRTHLGSLAHGFDPEDDELDSIVMKFWEPFLFSGKSSRIYSYDMKKPFITFLDAYLHSRFIRPWLFGRDPEADQQAGKTFKKTGTPHGGIKTFSGEKGARLAGKQVSSDIKFDPDEIDVAKDIAKVLTSISDGKETVGNIKPKDAELMMYYFGIRKPKLPYPEIQKKLGISYAIPQAVNDTIFRKDMFDQLRKKIAPKDGSERQAAFDGLVEKIKILTQHSSRHGECVFACF